MPDRVELLFERKGCWLLEYALRFGNGFLFCFVRLILLLPLLPAPVVHEPSGATGSFEVVHLFRGGVHPELVRGFHQRAPFPMLCDTSADHTIAMRMCD